MRESDADIDQLQALLDRSAAAAGPHLASIFDQAHRASAKDILEKLNSVFEVHLACVTPSGAPLLAPIDAGFFRGRIWFGLPAGSVRARLLRRDQRVSASYVDGSFGLIVHGTCHRVEDGSPTSQEFEAAIVEQYVARYGPAFLEWQERQSQKELPGEGWSGWIEPRVMFAKI